MGDVPLILSVDMNHEQDLAHKLEMSPTDFQVEPLFTMLQEKEGTHNTEVREKTRPMLDKKTRQHEVNVFAS